MQAERALELPPFTLCTLIGLELSPFPLSICYCQAIQEMAPLLVSSVGVVWEFFVHYGIDVV